MKMKTAEKEIVAQKEDSEKKPKWRPNPFCIKTAVIIATLIVLAAILFYYKGFFVAATVNGSPVSRLSVVRELENEQGKKALDSMIVKKLLTEDAKKKGVVISSEEVKAEVQKIEEQVKAQGGVLDTMLAAQGMTRKNLEEQITLQKKLEKLLADKIQPTDEEVTQFLAEGKMTVPKEEEEKYKEQAKEQLRGQKLNDEAKNYLESLKTGATIHYFVNY
jgi:foldase protein PrsA